MILNQNLKFFQSSKNGLNDKIQPISRTLCDFGKGFYMGIEPEQPLTLICNYENATIYELELNTNNLNIKEIPLNLDWALFVVLDRFFDGAITDIALVESLSALKLGIQHVAITQKVCNSIQIINEHKLTKGEENLLYAIMEENQNLKTGKTYDTESLFWIGYTYRYWYFLTKQYSKDIVKKCNAQMMHVLYLAYHTLDCKQAIKRILEA